ncbi:MAG: Acetyltransferase domain [Solirubrobacteraceae bacterium]|nr:Acetyltransferase domain [Solirubrobacteraceae bacterium]
MAHRGERPAPDPRATECDRREVVHLRGEWLAAEVPRPEITDQLLAADERMFTRTPTRAFTVDGNAMTLLVGDGPIQMIEDVYTRPAHRRQGLASALVRTAVANATAGFVFLPTAAGGDAHRLYAQLGFEDLGRTSMFWREGPDEGP